MGFPVLVSRTVLMVACVALVIASNDRPVWAAVCHDGNWEDGEFCGRDAYLVTSTSEMNHDCDVDMLDFSLFGQDFGLVGPNLSGDLDGNGLVTGADFLVFASTYGNSASPCTVSGMLPDLCHGTIALSHSDDPNTIVSTATLSPGSHFVYVVISGWMDPEVLEYGIETSPNVEILYHDGEYPYWEQCSTVWCDPDPEQSYRMFVRWGGPWPTGPIRFAYVEYQLTDSDPAWLKLVPVPPSCAGNSRLRWAKAAANRSFDFQVVLNAGINGPAPPSELTCSPPIPTLSEWGLIAFGMLLLSAMALAVRRRRAAWSLPERPLGP